MSDAVAAHQISAVLRRVRELSVDMFVIAVIVLVSLVPALSIEFFRLLYIQMYATALPWSHDVI